MPTHRRMTPVFCSFSSISNSTSKNLCRLKRNSWDVDEIDTTALSNIQNWIKSAWD